MVALSAVAPSSLTQAVLCSTPTSFVCLVSLFALHYWAAADLVAVLSSLLDLVEIASPRFPS